MPRIPKIWNVFLKANTCNKSIDQNLPICEEFCAFDVQTEQKQGLLLAGSYFLGRGNGDLIIFANSKNVTGFGVLWYFHWSIRLLGTGEVACQKSVSNTIKFKISQSIYNYSLNQFILYQTWITKFPFKYLMN